MCGGKVTACMVCMCSETVTAHRLEDLGSGGGREVDVLEAGDEISPRAPGHQAQHPHLCLLRACSDSQCMSASYKQPKQGFYGMSMHSGPIQYSPQRQAPQTRNAPADQECSMRNQRHTLSGDAGAKRFGAACVPEGPRPVQVVVPAGVRKRDGSKGERRRRVRGRLAAATPVRRCTLL